MSITMNAPSFNQRVYALVAAIPRGKVTSYGEIARALGNPRGARTVGWAMRNCPEGLPWHRVVMADGTVTGGDFAAQRRAMLEEENIQFTDDERVDMKRHFFALDVEAVRLDMEL
ncbi:MAG: methylated-DNA--[protein]-cysteine S-methyltransferase [Defluviitaleaceae bacterium]|nr:methylated-DNA--[protein]-cysteine S-methyltransferase [Defluviitaleaceae bacterium]